MQLFCRRRWTNDSAQKSITGLSDWECLRPLRVHLWRIIPNSSDLSSKFSSVFGNEDSENLSSPRPAKNSRQGSLTPLSDSNKQNTHNCLSPQMFYSSNSSKRQHDFVSTSRLSSAKRLIPHPPRQKRQSSPLLSNSAVNTNRRKTSPVVNKVSSPGDYTIKLFFCNRQLPRFVYCGKVMMYAL